MKSRKIVYLEGVLRLMSRAILWKYKPGIVGVTGSIGKSSAKEAIVLALRDSIFVRGGEKNYNNEIGIPLTIIGEKSGEGSVFGWLRVFLKWVWIMIFPVKYPHVIVLEMGVDRPKDMNYLLSFVSVNVAVVTDISGSHLEYFGTIEKIAKEKWKLAEAVSAGGVIVANADNKIISELMSRDLRDEVDKITFGFSEGSVVRATDVHYHYHEEELNGVSFKLNYRGKVIPVRLPNVIARHQIYAVLAGISVGIHFKVNPIKIINSVEKFVPPIGRMTLLKGLGGSVVIDDTYNASKASVIAALELLGEMKSARKVAVLGDMLELGSRSQADHVEVVRRAMDIGDEVFVVGKRMREAVEEVMKKKGESEVNQCKINIFFSPETAAENIKKTISSGDVVLVKGSQSMRMEKVVEAIVAESVDIEKRLCRQSADWKSRPFIQP